MCSDRTMTVIVLGSTHFPTDSSNSTTNFPARAVSLLLAPVTLLVAASNSPRCRTASNFLHTMPLLISGRWLMMMSSTCCAISLVRQRLLAKLRLVLSSVRLQIAGSWQSSKLCQLDSDAVLFKMLVLSSLLSYLNPLWSLSAGPGAWFWWRIRPKSGPSSMHSEVEKMNGF